MIKEKKILAIIPARGGSKGLPGKNLKTIMGLPLIAWTINRALESRYLDRVIVSTDNADMIRVSEEFGAEVPFIRPAELATDTASSCDVILHALGALEKDGDSFYYVALLEPTSPLRKPEDIDRGIEELVRYPDKDTLVSLGDIHLEHPMAVKKVEKGMVIPYSDLPSISQRQQADKAYFPYGVLYLSKVDAFRQKRTFYGDKTLPFFIERWQNYEIDDIVDFMVVEKIMEKYADIMTAGGR